MIRLYKSVVGSLFLVAISAIIVPSAALAKSPSFTGGGHRPSVRNPSVPHTGVPHPGVLHPGVHHHGEHHHGEHHPGDRDHFEHHHRAHGPGILESGPTTVLGLGEVDSLTQVGGVEVDEGSSVVGPDPAPNLGATQYIYPLYFADQNDKSQLYDRYVATVYSNGEIDWGGLVEAKNLLAAKGITCWVGKREAVDAGG